MAIKPLPYRAQKRAKKICAILTVFTGLVFAGALSTLITLSALTKGDTYLDDGSQKIISLKEVSDDRYVYSTEENLIKLCDKENKVKSSLNIKEEIETHFSELPNFEQISSLSYSKESNTVYATGYFKDTATLIDYTYLFEVNISGDNLSLNSNAKYVETENYLKFCCDGEDNNFYAAIRRRNGKSCSIVEFVHDTDGKLVAKNSFPLLSISKANATKIRFNVINPTVNDMFVYNNKLYSVFNDGIISLNLSAEKKAEWSQISEGEKDTNSWDFSMYTYHTVSQERITGGYLFGNTYYCSTQFKMGKFSLSNLQEKTDSKVKIELIENVNLPSAAPTDKKAFFYNESNKHAIVLSADESHVSYFDFTDLDNIESIFVSPAEVKITDVVFIENDDIIYLCNNDVISIYNLLKEKNVNDSIKAIQYGKITPTMLFLSIIFGLIFILTLLCSVKDLFVEKLLDFIKNVKQNWFAYLFMAVCLTLLGMFCYYPAVGSITMSFFKYENNAPVVWNNFQNYKDLFVGVYSAATWKAFGNMVFFLATDVITAIIPPLIFAFFLTVMKSKKFSAFTRTLLFLPTVIPGIAKMMIWQNGIYGEYGIINNLIALFNGEKIKFFTNNTAGLWSLVLMGFPFVGSYLVFYGALMNIPGSYYEAAELEGLNVWKRFFKIDIPLIKPQIKYVVILTFIASVQNYGRTYMITEGSFKQRTPIHLMVDYIYEGRYGLSSALAAVLFVLLFFATLFNLRKQKAQLGDSI